MIGFDWIGLRKIEEAWAAAGSPLGTHRYDSLGRPLPPLYGYFGQQASRAQRVYDALQQSGAVAQSLLAQRLRSISLAAVWDVLEHLVKEIAFLYGGAAVGGGVIGAVLGAFAGGVGAIPGAVAGGGIGVGAATVYLEWMGLFCLARGLASAFSAAAACYLDGMREAWGPPPDTGSFHQEPGAPTGNVGLAAQRIAEGHVQLLIALLSGIAMYLMRGGAERLKVLSEIRASKKLGPRVERWVVENEKALVREPGLQTKGTPATGATSSDLPSTNSARSRSANIQKGFGANRRTVLGHFPEYKQLGESLGARTFTVPEAAWNRMSEAERWAANQKFLDRIISSGDEIVLATPLDRVRPGSYFARELEYMASKGFIPTADGTKLVRPEFHD